jgi:dihydroneopterin aldolase
MSDQIYLRDYTVVAKHGYYKEEHAKPQRFVVSITADTSLENAGTTDILGETVNYEQLRNIAHEVLMQSPKDLIESLAEEIALRVLALARVDQVIVQIEKPDVWIDSVP